MLFRSGIREGYVRERDRGRGKRERKGERGGEREGERRRERRGERVKGEINPNISEKALIFLQPQLLFWAMLTSWHSVPIHVAWARSIIVESLLCNMSCLRC